MKAALIVFTPQELALFAELNARADEVREMVKIYDADIQQLFPDEALPDTFPCPPMYNRNNK